MDDLWLVFRARLVWQSFLNFKVIWILVWLRSVSIWVELGFMRVFSVFKFQTDGAKRVPWTGRSLPCHIMLQLLPYWRQGGKKKSTKLCNMQHYVTYNYMFRSCKWAIIRLFVEPVSWLYNRSLGGEETPLQHIPTKLILFYIITIVN